MCQSSGLMAMQPEGGSAVKEASDRFGSWRRKKMKTKRRCACIFIPGMPKMYDARRDGSIDYG